MDGKRSVDGAEEYDAALVEALRGLDGGAEPPMPDLVPDARVRGARIRRRRRIGVVASTLVVTAVAAVAGYAVLTSAPGSRHTVPATQPSVWYPSQALLQSVLPPSAGRVEVLKPEHPLRPGQYFKLTDLKGRVTDLYVSVARTVTGPLPAPGSEPKGFGPCERDGHALVTTWDSLIHDCVTVQGPGVSLLHYFIDKNPLPAPGGAEVGSSSSIGESYLSPDGWTVQVITGPLDGVLHNTGSVVGGGGLLSDLATEPQLLAAAQGSGG